MSPQFDIHFFGHNRMSWTNHILFLKNLYLQDKIVKLLIGNWNFKGIVKKVVAKVSSEQDWNVRKLKLGELQRLGVEGGGSAHK